MNYQRDRIKLNENNFLCTSRYVASENWIKVAEKGNKKTLKV
jgi:hypothetical protein